MITIHTLECAVCGASCRGRQWWNRDTGYGVCVRCGTDEIAKYGREEAEDCYGKESINWNIKEGDAC